MPRTDHKEFPVCSKEIHREGVSTSTDMFNSEKNSFLADYEPLATLTVL